MNTITKTFRAGARLALPALLVAASQATLAQTPKPLAPARAMTASISEGNYMRASALIGKNVHGADNKNIGEVNDMIIDVTSGEVRYVMFEYDPSVFKSGKVYVVPADKPTRRSDAASCRNAPGSRRDGC